MSQGNKKTRPLGFGNSFVVIISTVKKIKMKRLLFISNWLYLFSLSLWVAGMFLLGILVEIMVRINLKDQKLVASTIMNKIMDVFNINIIYTCITIILLAEVIKFLAAKYSAVGYEPELVTKRRYTREVFLAVMIVLAIYVGSVLRPEMHAMDKLKKANPADQKLQIQFDRFHSQLTWLYTINMVLGLSLFYIHGKEIIRFSMKRTESR
jgi:hypothetical protein